MNEEIQMYIDDASDKMSNAVGHLEATLMKIRAGKADIGIIDGIKVDYYGALTPINQVANVSVPDATTVSIQPWDKGVIGTIEKAIMAANIGITPINNGEVIRLNIPPVTEEKRKDLSKQVRAEGENSKISIRNIRRETNDEIKKLKNEGVSEDMVKDAEGEVQKLTDDFSKKVDELVALKEKDLMTV